MVILSVIRWWGTVDVGFGGEIRLGPSAAVSCTSIDICFTHAYIIFDQWKIYTNAYIDSITWPSPHVVIDINHSICHD